jgi:hypothetical protein
MVKKDIPTLKINKLTQEQYNEALANNMIDEDSIYLTPTTVKDYALKSDLNNKADLINGKIPMKQIPDEIMDVNLTNYYTKSEIDDSLSKKVELINGKIPENLIPKEI